MAVIMFSGQGSCGRDAFEPLEMPSGARSVKTVLLRPEVSGRRK